MGQKVTSLRIPAGRYQDLALALVRQAGLRQVVAKKTWS